MIDSNRTVAEIGEFELIDLLARALPPSVQRASGLMVPIGDDAAVVSVPAQSAMVVTTDTMVEWDHFRLDWTDWTSLGHKLLAVNLSDLAAMGAAPLAVTITLGLTGRERVSDLIAMYEGIGALAEPFSVGVAGGDIVRSRTDLFLECTALGHVPPTRAVTRSGAQAGDAVVVSGTLGAAAAGWTLLKQGKPSAATADLLIGAHLRPTPRLALGARMFDAGVTAAMDLSDGLSMDLPKIAGASGVGMAIESARIPVAAALRALFPDDWRSFIWSGGEDYELMMTIPEQRLEGFRSVAEAIGSTLTRIGTVTGRAGEVYLDGVAMSPEGWDHFG